MTASEITVLPQRSRGSTSAPRRSSNSTTSVRPWQAATWSAVRPSMSVKLTSLPASSSSSIPSKSPSLARYINRTVGSSASDTSPAPSRSGAREDCRPSEKRSWSFLASIAAARVLGERENVIVVWECVGFNVDKNKNVNMNEKGNVIRVLIFLKRGLLLDRILCNSNLDVTAFLHTPPSDCGRNSVGFLW